MPSNLDSLKKKVMFYGLYHGKSPCFTTIGENLIFGCSLFPSASSQKKQILSRNRNIRFQARMKMQLEEMRAKLEKVRWKEGGPLEKKSTSAGSLRWFGKGELLSRWWFQRFLYFHPDPWRDDPILTCAYFSDGWFNYANYSFLKFGRFWVIYSESVFFLTMCCFCVFSRDSNACLLRC